MHIPVLQKEVIEYLDPKPNENFIDCTLGEAGHAAAILEKTGPKGKLLGIDFEIRVKSQERLILAKGNFANLKEIVKESKFSQVNGILFDLGLSSWHLEESGRGLSFQKNEPLDMRFDQNNQLTAERICNYWSFQEIEKILREYGQEQFSRQIAKEIIEARKFRPLKTTNRLVEIIKKATPGRFRQKINPATKTFQALRIAVNDELNNLKKALPEALEVLKSGGRLAVISFHSLEDKIVKDFFKQNSLQVLIKKPITPTLEEIKNNPRSRSAKLRVAKKL